MPVTRIRAVNISRNQLLADNVRVANNFFTRLRGLLFTDSLPLGDGLLIKPCNSIHTFGMAYPIDAIFLDKKNIIIATFSNLTPGRTSSFYWHSQACLELPAGTVDQNNTTIGDQLQFIDY